MSNLQVDRFVTPENQWEGLQRVTQNMENRQSASDRMALLKQREQQEEDWRKLNLIQDLTDLSKHQTGSDVANAIGNREASNVLQKYTAQAKTLSGADLMAGIKRDMSGVISSMDAAKNELTQADEQLKIMKQQYPDLDIGAVAKDYRADILNRRLKGESFINPLEVQSTQLDFTNPEYLSKYLRTDNRLREAIRNPKGLEDIGVASGNFMENIEYGGKMPFWKQPNYSKEDFKDGFLKKGFVPELKTKEIDLPTTLLSGENGTPLKGVSPEVYGQFGDHQMEIIYNARKKFPDYDSMPQEKKVAAQMNVLRDLLDLDKTNFRYITSRRAPVTSNRTTNVINMGQGSINDMYGRITDEVKRLKEFGETTTPASLLNLDEQNAIIDFVNKSRGEDDKYKIEDLHLQETDRGTVVKSGRNGNIIGTLPKIGTNIKVQPDVKAKRSVVAQGENKTTNAPKKSNMVTMVMPDGSKGQIPEDQVSNFLKEYPKAKRQ